MRKETNLIVIEFTTLGGFLGVHFTNPRKLQGSDCDLWIPLNKTTSVHEVDFAEIEKIMQMNHIANNVTSITKTNSYPKGCEYHVIYNECQPVELAAKN